MIDAPSGEPSAAVAPPDADPTAASDAEMQVEIDPGEFRRVLGTFPTGVTVVATADAQGAAGLAIGSFFSVSLEPPLVGFCVSTTSGTWPRIEANGTFAVSVLAEDQAEVSGRFASRVADKFEGLEWFPSPVTGSPLIRGAVTHLDCRVEQAHLAGDHWIVVGRVAALDVHREVGPLLFLRGGYGRHEALD